MALHLFTWSSCSQELHVERSSSMTTAFGSLQGVGHRRGFSDGGTCGPDPDPTLPCISLGCSPPRGLSLPLHHPTCTSRAGVVPHMAVGCWERWLGHCPLSFLALSLALPGLALYCPSSTLALYQFVYSLCHCISVLLVIKSLTHTIFLLVS